VVRFNAEGPDGLIDRKAPSKPSVLTPAQCAALAAAVEAGPESWRNGVVRWRLVDLVQWLRDEFRVSVSAATVGRELCALGFRKLAARPRHHAGWHLAGALVVPDIITLLPLPPRSLELNPVENVWQVLRDNHLSNRVFQGHDDIDAHCSNARNGLMDQPWRTRSIGRRARAEGF
jgi:hypothetical protein